MLVTSSDVADRHRWWQTECSW